MKSDINVAILFLCDRKQCANCSSGMGQCFHTTQIAHSVNYSSCLEINLENGFDLFPATDKLIYFEKDC